MDKFITRLKYYGIGFAIGLVFVFIFFQNRGCSWLPSNRVKNSILERVIIVSETESELLKEKNISTKQIISYLENGKVHFNESKKEGFLKVYVLSLNSKKLYFLMSKDSYIAEVKYPVSNINKIKLSDKGYASAIHFPKESNLIYADSTSFKDCKAKENYLSDSKKFLKILKRNSKVNLEKSDHFASPKATIYWNIFDGKDSVEINTYWYKNKINIFELKGKEFSNCDIKEKL